MIRGQRRFIQAFGKAFEFVTIQSFVFEKADYKQISLKEVREIREIFKQFDIAIKELTSVKKAK